MSADRTIELGGFERRLLAELRTVVAEHAAERVAEPVSRRAPSWRRPLIAGLAVAATACVVVLVALSSGPAPSLAQAFPILSRAGTPVPPALAGVLRSNGASAHQAKLDLRHARPFRTPLGTGYVLTDQGTDLICVAAPSFDRSWGASCGNAGEAMRAGVGGLGYGPRGVSFVDVLPAGATATVQTPGAPARPAALHDGVLAFVTDRATTVTTRVAGHVTVLRLAVPTRPRRMPVPPPSRIAATMHLRTGEAHGVPTLTATFRARYPARRALSAYVLEIAPLTHPAGCMTGDSIDDQTAGNIRAGQLVALSGGAPNCAGRWRVTVFYAVPNGGLRYPGAWPQGLGTARTAPKGSGDQIVATRVIAVPPATSGLTGGVGRGRRTSTSGG